MVFLSKKTIFIYMGTTPKNIVDYFSKPLTSDQINYLNKLHEVTVEKCELYRDFIISLNYCIYDTYLGDDVINSEDNLLTHYNWCWQKTIDDFGEENLFFVQKGEHYYYFLNYFSDTFYNIEEKTDLDLSGTDDYWSNLFRYDANKTKSQYNIFIQVYKLMDDYFLNND